MMQLIRWYRRQPCWWRLIVETSPALTFILGYYYYIGEYRVWTDLVNEAARIAAEAKVKP